MNLPPVTPRNMPSPALSASSSLPYTGSPNLLDFEIEHSSKPSAATSRRVASRFDELNIDEEFLFRDSVSRVLAARSRPFTISGRIPFDTSSLVLFFRSKVSPTIPTVFSTLLLIVAHQNGSTHSLDFPIEGEHDVPSALSILIASCITNTSSFNFDQFSASAESLVYPPHLPLTATLEISNHPIMDAVRSTLFPSLPAGHYLTVLRDKLDVIQSGRKMSPQNHNDGRVATINITLPVRFRGGTLVIRDIDRSEERYSGRGGKGGDMEWVAFLAECEYEVEPVNKGCKLTISYGVYPRTFGPAGAYPDPLIAPSANFLDLFSPILNTMRGRKIAFYLINDYGINPSEVLAESLVPYVSSELSIFIICSCRDDHQLKGGDSLLYHALKVYNLIPELHWTAGGYIWPIDCSVDCGSEITVLKKKRHSSTGIPVRGIFATTSTGSSEMEENEIMRNRVEAGGGISLTEAGISLLVDWTSPGPHTGKERVPFVSGRGLEKLVVNIIMVTYIP